MVSVKVIIYCISSFSFTIMTLYNVLTMHIVKGANQMALESCFTFFAGLFLVNFVAASSFYSNLVISTAFRQKIRMMMNYRLKYVFRQRVGQVGPATQQTTRSVPIVKK